MADRCDGQMLMVLTALHGRLRQLDAQPVELYEQTKDDWQAVHSAIESLSSRPQWRAISDAIEVAALEGTL